jgi:HlyD family secretion protein
MSDFLGWAAGLLAALIPGMGDEAPAAWPGYVEADYVYVGAVSPGPIQTIAVSEGDAVRKGEVLFVLSSEQQRAALAAASARVEAARANLDNLTTGSRSEEVDVIRANLGKAQADLGLADQTLSRTESLFQQGLVPEAKLEADRASYAIAQAQVAQLQAQLKVAELPARDAQQQAAEANLTAAEADAERARSDLADRTVRAPEDGQVDQLYFSAGEVVGTGVPVVALLPAGALKVKFYVPEATRHGLALGQGVTVACDGCVPGLTARVSYLASQPQNTPPIIYSRDERSRLVFLVEARLDQPEGVLPGQPVSVERVE